MMSTNAKIAFVAGLVLVVLGVVLTVFSMPILAYTREGETHQIPKSEIIMDYSISLQWTTGTKDVAVEMSPDQDLSFIVESNMLSRWPYRTFDFSIVAHQPDGIDAIYFSRKDTKYVNDHWSPATSGMYYLHFSSIWAGYIDGMDISAKVTKTWTELVTDIEKGSKSLIDSKFAYMGSSMIVLGTVYLGIGLCFAYRRRIPIPLPP